MELGFSLCIMNSVSLSVCVNFLCFVFLDIGTQNITFTGVSSPLPQISQHHEPWMSIYIKIKVCTFTVSINFIPSEHRFPLKPNPITAQKNICRIPSNFRWSFCCLCWVFTALQPFPHVWGARAALQLWCIGFSLGGFFCCRVWLPGLSGFHSFGTWAH